MIEIFSFILSLLCIFISSKRGNDFQDFHFPPTKLVAVSSLMSMSMCFSVMNFLNNHHQIWYEVIL
jgi:hypothetical protein